MKDRQDHRGIFWMVRLLAAVGLTTIVGLIALVGLQVGSIRTERVKLEKEQRRLSITSEDILHRAGEAHGEIAGLFDQNDDAFLGKSGAADRLAEVLDSLAASADPSMSASVLKRLDTLTDRLADLEERALAWHVEYDMLWQDSSQQRTMNRVRGLLAGLSNAEEMLEGRRRLQEAIEFKRWRAAGGEVAASLAKDIITGEVREQNRGAIGLERELAEMASLAELLGGEEQLDNLGNLKDNKLKPALDRLGHDLVDSGELRLDDGLPASEALEKLGMAFFGEGYSTDPARQTIRIGKGGLYALRRDTLLLRLEREKLKSEWSALSHEIDVAVSDFVQSTRAQSESLAGQVEQDLASSWRRMMIAGAGCAGLFVWLAWWISRAIRSQVGLIERAKVEAESRRQTAQRLLQDLQKLQRDHELILNAIGEGIHWIDTDGRIVFENPAAGRMLGWEASELRGQLAHATMHHTRADGSSYPVDECPIYASLRTGMSQRVANEVFWRKDGTSIPVDYMTTAVRDENGRIIGAAVVFTDITERRRTEKELEVVHQQLLETSRLAGRAEVATNVLHNVGNVLNSVNISASLVRDRVKKSRTSSLEKVVALFREHEEDLGTFITTDPQGRRLPAYLGQLSEHLLADQETTLHELESLGENIDHIKVIVAMQQRYATVGGVKEMIDLVQLVDDSLRLNESAFRRHGVKVIREFAPVPSMNVEKHKVLQILANVLRNAKHACQDSDRPDKRIAVRVANGEDRVRISVTDNGVGILPENLTRIFNHGFTTREDGHGFGLHSGALAAKELGGSLTMRSDGPGQGATCTLELPCDSHKTNS